MLPHIAWPNPAWAGKAWLIGCLVLAALLELGLLRTYLDLSSRVGVWTMIPGTIAATDCRNHATIVYEYTVAGTTHRSSGSSSGGDIACDRARPGDAIGIYVDPAAPSRSMIGAPERRLSGFWVNLIVMPGLAVVAGVLGFFDWKSRRRA